VSEPPNPAHNGLEQGAKKPTPLQNPSGAAQAFLARAAYSEISDSQVRRLEFAVMRDSRQFTRKLLKWYDRHRRDLPWRVSRDARAGDRPNPYHVLVSEAMLQQTQVKTVVPYFRRFTERFPAIDDLAGADEQDVLRLWQGLGYYSRARNLHAAAKKVVAEFRGEIPPDPDALRTLPGVGRYTAGAIASIAFDRRAPILDGNVARVLCRLDRISTDPREPQTQKLLWRRAEEILPARRAGDFNSALMELGATVCTPRAPKCLACPVREHCKALAAGEQERIPSARKAKPTPLVVRNAFCIRHVEPDRERFLLEQRPTTGRWAGLWQFITRPPNGPVRARELGTIAHGLTHMRYEFRVLLVNVSSNRSTRLAKWIDSTRAATWVTLDELDDYPLSRPQLRIAQMLRERNGAETKERYISPMRLRRRS
jgi:A/G-specific adenine glycosylase